MPWEKSYNEIDVLERAMHAFWARGYEATSMEDLVAATGINRGSIYAAYTNKHALFMHALRHYDKIHRADHLARIAEQHAPKDAILAAFDDLPTPGEGKPRLIVADTIKGRGVGMMESNLNWHVGNLVGRDYDAVVAEIERGLQPAGADGGG